MSESEDGPPGSRDARGHRKVPRESQMESWMELNHAQLEPWREPNGALAGDARMERWREPNGVPEETSSYIAEYVQIRQMDGFSTGATPPPPAMAVQEEEGLAWAAGA